MKVKFISSTHSVSEELNGREGDLRIGMNATFMFEPIDVSFELRKGTWRTSQIKNIEYDEISMGCYNIVINTNNSEYVFQYGTPSDKEPFTDEERMALALMTMV